MKKTVLIIEDNAKNRYLFKFLLESGGIAVLCAETGKDGLLLGHQVRPDLILLDIQLPEVDGFMIFKQLQADPILLKIPVVAITSYAMPGDREAILEAGFTGYIEKPIDSDQFIDLVKSYLNKEIN